jgi:hypothetical protein
MDTKSTIGTGVIAVALLGASFVAGAQTIDVDKITPVKGEDHKPEDQRNYLVPVQIPYNVEQVRNEIVALNQRIDQTNRDLVELTSKRDEKQALLNKLQVEVDKK